MFRLRVVCEMGSLLLEIRSPQAYRLSNKPRTMACISVNVAKQIVLRPPRLLHVRHIRCTARDPEQGSPPAAAARPTSPAGRAHPPGGAAPATACLNGWPARKHTTRRAGMAAAAPVLGLRPTRARLAHTCHVPKRRRMTGSPCCKLALIVVRMASTAASAVAVVDPSSWAIRCTISAFLIVRCSVFLVDVRRVWQSAVDPVDVAGVLLAWQARYPH